MIPSNRSVRTRSFRRRMGLAGLSLGLLLGHVTAAFATWYDTDVVSPVFCSQQPTHRAYGYVRSDGVSAIAFADGAGAPVGMLEGSIGNWAYTNMTQYGAPATYSDPVGYERSDGIPTVVYPGAVTWGHVYELARVAGTWVVSDLHMAAGILTYGGVYPGTF